MRVNKKAVGSSFASTYSFDDLAAGKYRFDVDGLTGGRKGLWVGQMTVGAVPEADTWLMLLVGGGLIAYQLRRKQRALPPRSFAAA